MNTTKPTVTGVDLYHGDAPLESFHAMKSAGVAFAFLKASQGVHSADPRYKDFSSRAEQVGMIRGAYHFFTADDPEAQAEHFVACAALKTGDLKHALDVETEFAAVGQRALLCAAKIKALTGHWPIIYSDQAFYLDHLARYFPAKDHTLWIARYGKLAPTVACSIWQYNDAGRINGASHPLDTDRFYGSLDDLKTHCI